MRNVMPHHPPERCRSPELDRTINLLLALLVFLFSAALQAQTDWPCWRGPGGNGVAADPFLPIRWDGRTNILWSSRIPGEGASSPIVSGSRVYVTSAEENGRRRSLHSLDRATGNLLWTSTLEDESPELSSSVTGHAASTPATDGARVLAFFGNAGAACHDTDGRLLWRRRLGVFETELGLATSPVIRKDRAFIVCDHDGDRLRSFDSFLAALDLGTGEVLWKTERPGLFRSWSTPLIAPGPRGEELVVCGQGEVRGYDPAGGALLWRIRGLNDWIAPSPVFGGDRLVVAGGKEGPLLAARPGGRGDATESHIIWRKDRTSPYVSSPLLYAGRVYVIEENGVLSAFRADSGERLFRERLAGKFTASPIAGAGSVYFTAEEGTTWVLEAGDTFKQLARNELDEYMVASPAAAGGRLFFRTEHHVHCVDDAREKSEADGLVAAGEARAVDYLALEVPRWSRENRCFSCHNDGDGSRALFAARAASLRVPESSWADTSAWLLDPGRWTEDRRFRDYGHPDLATLHFATALVAGNESGAVDGKTALARAAEIVARSQLDDGSWPGGSRGGAGSPTAYSRHLATYAGRRVLVAAGAGAHEEPRRRAETWLRKQAPENVHQAAVLLLALSDLPDPSLESRLSECLESIQGGRSPEGGWGPYGSSAPEAFDTALVLLGLDRIQARLARGPEEENRNRRAKVARWIRDGRGFLLKTQRPDGSWQETTRPPGAESYALRISTTAWAALALIATR